MAENAGRIPPNDKAAETAVLGAVLLRNKVLEDIYSLITAEDFYVRANANLWKGIYKQCCVGMKRLRENALSGTKLYHASGVHNSHSVGYLIVNSHVMAYDHHGVFELLLKPCEHHQDAPLNNNVKSCGRLIRKYHIGRHEGCECYYHALSHTT